MGVTGPHCRQSSVSEGVHTLVIWRNPGWAGRAGHLCFDSTDEKEIP